MNKPTLPPPKGDRPLAPGEDRREWWEPYPCEECGFVKRTRFYRTTWSKDLSYRKVCTPCEQERSATVHEQTAARLRRAARLARAARTAHIDRKENAS